jgi:hypothetical protein
MIDVLKGSQLKIDAFLLVVNGEEVRWDPSFYTTLELYAHIFGPKFWDRTLVVVNHWQMNENAKQRRKRTGRIEHVFEQEV